MTQESLPPPGWYPSTEPGGLRYWDGHAWTDHTLPATRRPRRPVYPWSAIVLVSIGAAMWFVALFLHAYDPVDPAAAFAIAPDSPPIRGATAFMLGAVFLWLPIGPWVAWWANPLMFVALILTVARRAPRTRIILAASAFLFSLVALAVDEYRPDEGGSRNFAIEPAWGCFLWIASMGLMLAATVLVRARTSKPRA